MCYSSTLHVSGVISAGLLSKLGPHFPEILLIPLPKVMLLVLPNVLSLSVLQMTRGCYEIMKASTKFAPDKQQIHSGHDL